MLRALLSRLVHTLRRSTTPELSLQTLLETLYSQTGTIIDNSPQRPHHACTAGCAWCCYLPVDMTVPEALGIVFFLRTSVAAEHLQAFQQRLAARVERLKTLTFAEHSRAHIPCILLHNNTCIAYPYRPLACRAWLSTSAQRCETVYHGDPLTMLPPLDMETYSAVWGAGSALQASLQQHHLENTTYEFHSLLYQLLQTPDPITPWLQGHTPEGTRGAFAAT